MRRATEPGHPAARSVLPAVRTGSLIGGRYRLEGLLGRGGMGAVYAATHLHTGRPVAIKLIDCAWDDATHSLYRRFLSEARSAAAVRHPNIVDVLDMGYQESLPFLVMEQLRGQSLEQVLEHAHSLALDTALAWLLPVMGALQNLHQRGIIHRDVKPSNIFLAFDSANRLVPKLLDFGLARVIGEAPLTAPGTMLGTPEYMAPERILGRDVSPASDVWSMGMVVCECLCGALPFTAAGLPEIAAQLVTGDVLKAQTVDPRLPPPLGAVIDRALTFEPARRHADMATFARALARAARGVGANVPHDPDPVGLPGFSAQQTHVGARPAPRMLQEDTPTARSAGWPRRANAYAIRILLGLLMVLAGAASWELHERGRPKGAAVPSLHPQSPVPLPIAPSVTPLVEPLIIKDRKPPDAGTLAVKPRAEPAPSPPQPARVHRSRTLRGDAQRRHTAPVGLAPNATAVGFEKEWL